MGADVSGDEKEYRGESYRKETKDTLRKGYRQRAGGVMVLFLLFVWKPTSSWVVLNLRTDVQLQRCYCPSCLSLSSFIILLL